jgi:hypothetical protein
MTMPNLDTATRSSLTKHWGLYKVYAALDNYGSSSPDDVTLAAAGLKLLNNDRPVPAPKKFVA